MNYLRIILLFFIFFLSQGQIHSQTWLGKILPLQTSKEEVKELISGYPDDKVMGRDTYVYLLKEGGLEIDFSPGRCISGVRGKWNVEKGVVIQVHYSPVEMKKLSSYERSRRHLKREFDTVWWHYYNLERGIDYTMQNGRVYSITYYIPTLKQSYLKCKD